MLCKKTWPNWVGMPKEGLKELLKVLSIEKLIQGLGPDLDPGPSVSERPLTFSHVFAGARKDLLCIL